MQRMPCLVHAYGVTSLACASDSITVTIPVDIHLLTLLLHHHHPALLLPAVPLLVPDVVPTHLSLLAQVHALLHGAGLAHQEPGAGHLAVRVLVLNQVTH